MLLYCTAPIFYRDAKNYRGLIKFANQGSFIAILYSAKHFTSLIFAVKDAAVKTMKFMCHENLLVLYSMHARIIKQ